MAGSRTRAPLAPLTTLLVLLAAGLLFAAALAVASEKDSPAQDASAPAAQDQGTASQPATTDANGTPAAAPASSGTAGTQHMAGQAISPTEGSPAEGASPEGLPAPGALASQQRPLTPMHAEIQRVIEDEKAAVAALQARFEQTKDPVTAMEVQKQVQDTKIQTEITILQIQVRYARQEGHNDVATQLESAIKEMTTPKAAGTPIDRPAPQQTPARGSQQH